MIFRLSQKLSDRIKAETLATLPLDENPFADWSAGLFLIGRPQYILVTNTKSLYSTVLPAKGVTDEMTFIERALSSLSASESSWTPMGRRASTKDWSPLSADQFDSPRR